MSDDDDLLNVESSPTVATRKPRRQGKRVNNLPIILVSIGGAIVAGLIMMAIYDSSNQQNADDAQQNRRGGNALEAAREFIVPNQGIVEKKPEPVVEQPKPAPKPELIVVPAPPKLEKPPEPVVTPPPAPATPPPPKEDPNIARLRQKRLQMAENAIFGSVAIQASGSLNAIRRSTPHTAEMPHEAGTRVSIRSAGAAQIEGERNYSETHDLSATGQFRGTSDRWKPNETVETPMSRYLLRTGSVVPATLLTGLNSDLPGQIVAQVSQNVYDTATGNYLLIPQGTRLIGEYSSRVQYGQSRVFAVWQRIVFPDGKTLDIGAMPASTGAGYSGLKDRVNNHYFRIFGSALMMSAVIAGIDQAIDNDSSSDDDKKSMSDSMSEALGTTFGNLIAEMMRKNMLISPTIEIRPGFRLNVMLVRDLQFTTPYRAFDYTGKRQTGPR